MSRSESSVLFALHDLKRMENERRGEEALREAEARHQAELAEARALAAEAEARRRTEELARLFEAQARLVEAQATAERRVDALAAELARTSEALTKLAAGAAPGAQALPNRRGRSLLSVVLVCAL